MNLEVSIDQNELADEHNRKLCEVVRVNQKVFSFSIFGLPSTYFIEAKLDTMDAKSIQSRQHKSPPSAMEKVNRQINLWVPDK